MASNNARRPAVPSASASAKELDVILAGGQVVKTYPGTSQYQQGISISACGLASFNAVKCVLNLEKSGYAGPELLYQMLTRELIEHITKICTLWTSSAHLEVEDVYKFSWFARALQLTSTDYSQSTVDHFIRILLRLESQTARNRSAAAIITKPPEILAVFAIVTNQPSPRPSVIFAIFDSHSRPLTHPNGAAFTFFGTARAAATYLARLFAVDLQLANDTNMQWEAQMLSQVSAHCFVASEGQPVEPDRRELELDLFKADVAVLEVRAALSEAKSELADLRETLGRGRTERESLVDEAKMLRIQLEGVRKELRQTEEERDDALVQLEGGGDSKTDFTSNPSPPDRETMKGKHKEGMAFVNSNPLPRPPHPIATYSSESGWDNGPARMPRNLPESSSLQPRSSQPRSFSTSIHHGPSSSRLSSGSFNGYDKEVQGILQDQLLRDMQFAAEIQYEMDRENETLRRQHQVLLAGSQQLFDCRVCLETCPEDMMATLAGCDHVFCRECLLGHVKANLEENRFPILCPVCVTEEERSKERRGVATQEVLEMLGVSEEDFLKWVGLQLAGFSLRMQCPKCKETILVDRDDYQASNIIRCPMRNCDNFWCKHCSQTIESQFRNDHSCDGSKELDRLIQTNNWKRCPRCQTPIERTAGCDNMTCRVPGCNALFSYATGALR